MNPPNLETGKIGNICQVCEDEAITAHAKKTREKLQ